MIVLRLIFVFVSILLCASLNNMLSIAMQYFEIHLHLLHFLHSENFFLHIIRFILQYYIFFVAVTPQQYENLRQAQNERRWSCSDVSKLSCIGNNISYVNANVTSNFPLSEMRTLRNIQNHNNTASYLFFFTHK